MLAIWAAPLILGSLAETLLQTPQAGGWKLRILEAAAWMVWALVTPGIMGLTQRLPPRAPHLVLKLLAHGMMVTAILVLQLAVFALAEPWARLDTAGSFGERFVRMLSAPTAISVLLLYCAVAATAFGLELRHGFRQARARARQLERERTSLAQQLAESRLEALQRQLQPHFLFNTLHSISALMESDTNGARRMMSRLAGLLRAALAAPPEIPLEEELNLLEAFLDLERVRLGDRLQVAYDVAEAARGVPVPSMILQPLVENAIRHGLPKPASRPADPTPDCTTSGGTTSDGSSAVGRIQITATMVGSQLCMTIGDNGRGFGHDPDPSLGVGVTNTRARLAERYGPAAELTLSPGRHGGAEARLTLPVAERPPRQPDERNLRPMEGHAT